MSVINQMLRDLDARHAGQERGALPNEIRTLSPQRRSLLVPVLLAVATGGILLAASYFFLPGGWSGIHPPVPTVQPPVTVPAVAAISAPPVPGMTPADDRDWMSLRLSEVLQGERGKSSAAPTGSIAESPRAAPSPVATAAPTAPTPSSTGVLPPASAAVTELPLSKSEAKGEGRGSATARIEKTPLQPSLQEKAEAEYRRGMGLVSQGQLKDGAEALRQALKVDRNHNGARQLLVRVLLEQRAMDEVQELLNEAVQLQPGRYQWALSLARLQVERNDPVAAWQTLQLSMAAGSGSADYQGLAGNVLQRLGNYKEAADHYRGALRVSPNDGRWWVGLALALEAGGNTAEARQAFQNARGTGTLSAEMNAFVEQRLR